MYVNLIPILLPQLSISSIAERKVVHRGRAWERDWGIVCIFYCFAVIYSDVL